MFSFETTLLGVALALDAAVVSFAIGILNLELTKSQRISRGLIVCGLFGFFQALMIWLGSLGGYFLTFSGYGHLFQLLVALIFLIIAIRVLQESFKKITDPVEWGFIPLIVLAVATSLDALASGISMGPLPQAYMNSVEIGLITFLICGGAFFVSFYLKSFPAQWLLRLASVIFFFLGGKVLIDYF
ncbi:MAG: manganese efflux pump [Bdellovibrionales bacterium]|nr:manganese efflux pump [Bdellovibrionales bacterium]